MTDQATSNMGQDITHLMVDFNIGFTVDGCPLFVGGAPAGVAANSQLIKQHGKRIDNIVATGDAHHQWAVGHTRWWVDKHGKNPPPFTNFADWDVKNGIWQPRFPGMKIKKAGKEVTLLEDMIDYEAKLHARGKYNIVTWPDHCLTFTREAQLHDDAVDAILWWEREYNGHVIKRVKGTCPYREDYSFLRSEIEFPGDPATQLAADLLDVFINSRIILITGFATNFCVANGVRDIKELGGKDIVKKFVFMEDCCAPVTSPDPAANDFLKKLTDDFMNEMVADGMRIANVGNVGQYLN